MVRKWRHYVTVALPLRMHQFVNENPLAQIQQLEPRCSFKSAVVVPLTKFVKVQTIDMLSFPLVSHHVVADHVGSISDTAANHLVRQVKALATCRKGHNQDGSQKEKEIFTA